MAIRSDWSVISPVTSRSNQAFDQLNTLFYGKSLQFSGKNKNLLIELSLLAVQVCQVDSTFGFFPGVFFVNSTKGVKRV